MTEPKLPVATSSLPRPNRHWVEMAVGLATLLLLAALLIPALLAARMTARRNQSANNLRNLLISVHAFQTASHRLPPGGVVREEATGLRSWFVSIMPFVESSPLYERIVRYDAPWDDSVTRQWLTTEFDLVRNPLVDEGFTTDGWPLIHYAANPDVLYQNSRTSRDDLDHLSSCWLLGEVADGFVPWAYPFNWREPGDMAGSEGSAFRNPLGTCQFAMIDGRVVEISAQGSIVFLNASRRGTANLRRRTEGERPFARRTPAQSFASTTSRPRAWEVDVATRWTPHTKDREYISYSTVVSPDGRDVRTYVDAFGAWPRPSVLEAFRGAIAMAPGTTHLTLPSVSSECREGLKSLSRLRVMITDTVEDEGAIELISKSLKTLVLRRSADLDLEKSLRTNYPDLEILWRPAK